MNLINLVKEKAIDQSGWKILLIILLTVPFAVLFSYSLTTISLNSFYLALFCGGFFVIFILLQSIFIKNVLTLLIVNLINALILFSNFWLPSSSIFWATIILIFCFLIWGAFLSKREQQLLMKPSYFRITRPALSKTLTAISLFMLFVLYLYFSGQARSAMTIPPESIFRKMVAPSGKILNKLYPGFDFSLTVNYFLKTMALKQAQEIPNFTGATKEVQEKVIGQSVLELKNQLPGLKNLNLPESFFEKRIDDFIYSVLILYLHQLPSNEQTAVNFLLFISGFFIIRSIVVPFGWLVSFLGYLIFKFLIAVGFASIASETTQKETIVLT